MAITVSLINMKGGVGKSTLAANLAWQFGAYVKWAKNVLVVDLDPQFNASQYLLGVTGYTSKVVTPKKPTVWDIFEQNCPRRLNFDPPCRLNFDPGTGAAFEASGCG